MTKKELHKLLKKAKRTCMKCWDKYGAISVGTITLHEDICDVCFEEKLVTNVRDYWYFSKTLNW